MSEVLKHDLELGNNRIFPDSVLESLKKRMLIDGYHFVLDLNRSSGVKLVDARNGEEYFDFFSFFGSNPLGLNHPKLKTPKFIEKIIRVASNNKLSNSDIYSLEMAEFVDTFSRIAVPESFKYLFFIDGGSLAVENALKVAFDWKVRKNKQTGVPGEKGAQIIHFKDAFHGRTGYTLSLTNTDPVKISHFPKFKWPRIINPKISFPLEENLNEVIKLEEQAIDEIHFAIKNNANDIAAIIIEPIQAEGGDNHFRKEFLIKLREIASENDILLIFDEVQTGIGLTGKMWAFQHYVEPDIVTFGKKMQVCGIMVNDKIDEVPDHVFKKSSRINSTWGGNLVDMVRSTRNLEIIEEDNLVENAEIVGKYLINQLMEIQNEFSSLIYNTRGLGLFCAFDFIFPETRKPFLEQCFKHKLFILPCGVKTIRFRPVLDITKEQINEGLKIIRNVLYLLRNNL